MRNPFVTKVTETVRGWGYTHPDDAQLETIVRLLIDAVTADHGWRVSVHLADQEDMLLVAVLSHTGSAPDEGLYEIRCIRFMEDAPVTSEELEAEA
ncbi:hypothetical protein GTY86_04525, partial [Streptomyces sp. SID5770]|nr:hypothetical protein [Streptomyces sp. SID5770]